MSTIDEIKRALELCKRRPDRMNFAALELMIAAALADAERKGAEAMREKAAAAALAYCAIGAASSAEERAIRALPLPVGREPVRLTDEQIDELLAEIDEILKGGAA